MFTLTQKQKLITGLFTIALLQACGGGSGGGSGAGEGGSDNESGTTEEISVPKSKLTFFATGLDVLHDCDPDEDNPGDFVVITRVEQDDKEIAKRTTGEIYLHKEQYLNVIDRTSIVIDVEKVEGKPVEVWIDASERDGGLKRDPDSTARFKFTVQWDQNNWCWVNSSGNCLATNDAINWRAAGNYHLLGREDEFKLFNSDDEGCEYKIGWALGLNDDGTY